MIMNQRKTKNHIIIFSLAVVCAVWLAGTGFAVETTPPAPKQASATLNIKPGDLSGTIYNVQGKPLSGVQITTMDSKGEVTSKAVTGKDGGYKLVGLEEGKYALHIHGKKSGTLNITGESNISNLKAVIPAVRSVSNPSASREGGFNSANSESTTFKMPYSYIIVVDWDAQKDGPFGTTDPTQHGNVSP